MKWNTQTKRELGRVMDSLMAQIRDAEHKQLVIWEKTLRLHINERPWLMPIFLWSWLVSLVCTQSASEQVLRGPQEIPKEIHHEEKR